MNRSTFVYAIIVVLIAFSIGVLFSGAPAEAQRTRCIRADLYGLAACNLGGYVKSRNSREHLKQCDAGHWYYECWDVARRVHTAHNAPAPAPAPRQTTTQTTRQSRVQTPSQTPSQPPSQPAPRRPAQPQQQSCTAPTLTYKKWVIGQSATDLPNTDKPTTFITTSETSCYIEVQVGYDGSQGSNTCELTGVSFTVTMSHGFTGTPTVTPSGDGFSKVWTYKATLKGNKSLRLTGARCDGNWVPSGPGNSDKPEYPGRDGAMWVTIAASGTYSGGTVTLPPETVTQSLVDGLQQEYVDYDKNVIPSGCHFNLYPSGDSNLKYNWGHYF